MRPVNLLPDRYRPLRGSGQRSGIAYIATAVLAVLLLMVVLYVVTTNGINDAEQKTAEAKAEQAEAQARVGALQAYGDFATTRATRETAVRTVAGSRFDYERLMREIALVLPHNTFLTTLTASSGGGAAATATATPTAATTTGTTGGGAGSSVAIAGCAPNHPAVATALVRLRKLHDVTNVELASSNKAGSGTSTGTATTGCAVNWT